MRLTPCQCHGSCSEQEREQRRRQSGASGAAEASFKSDCELLSGSLTADPDFADGGQTRLFSLFSRHPSTPSLPAFNPTCNTHIHTDGLRLPPAASPLLRAVSQSVSPSLLTGCEQACTPGPSGSELPSKERRLLTLSWRRAAAENKKEPGKRKRSGRQVLRTPSVCSRDDRSPHAVHCQTNDHFLFSVCLSVSPPTPFHSSCSST